MRLWVSYDAMHECEPSQQIIALLDVQYNKLCLKNLSFHVLTWILQN